MPTVFRWLTGSPAAGSVLAPNAQRIANGWVKGLPVPAGMLNWVWSALSQLTTSAQRFDSLEDAVEALQDGETGIVVEGDPDTLPFAGASNGQVGTQCLVAVSGAYIVVFDQTGSGPGGSFLCPRSESTWTLGGPSSKVALTLANTPTTQRSVAIDGVTFALAYDQYVDAFDATGTRLWSYNHGAAVHDVAVHGGQVFLCGALGTSSKHVRSISVSAGTETWGYRHSSAGVVYAIATNGVQVFFGGDVSSYTSTASLRAVDFATGNDDGNEGGTAASTTGFAWDDDNGGNTVNARCLAATGDRLVVGRTVTSVGSEIEVRAAGSGAKIAGEDYLTGLDGAAVAVDHRFAYVAQNDGATANPSEGAITVYDLESGHRAYQVNTAPFLTTNDGITTVATDGRAIWFTGQANATLLRAELPYHPELVRRVDGDEQGNALPMELQYVGGR